MIQREIAIKVGRRVKEEMVSEGGEEVAEVEEEIEEVEEVIIVMIEEVVEEEIDAVGVASEDPGIVAEVEVEVIMGLVLRERQVMVFGGGFMVSLGALSSDTYL